MPLYAIGDILYDKIEARRNILYKIVIKKVLLSPIEYLAGADDYYTYVDTLNSVHLEENLITYQQAIEMIESVYSNYGTGGVVVSGESS